MVIFFKYCLNSPFKYLYILDTKLKWLFQSVSFTLELSSLILKVAISSKLRREIYLNNNNIFLCVCVGFEFWERVNVLKLAKRTQAFCSYSHKWFIKGSYGSV